MLAASVAESTIAVTRPVPEKALEILLIAIAHGNASGEIHARLGHVYARLGLQTLGPPSKKEPIPENTSRSVLVCLPLHPEAKGSSERWDERWIVQPKQENGDLYKAHHWAAIPAEPVGFRTNGENERTHADSD